MKKIATITLALSMMAGSAFAAETNEACDEVIDQIANTDVPADEACLGVRPVGAAPGVLIGGAGIGGAGLAIGLGGLLALAGAGGRGNGGGDDDGGDGSSSSSSGGGSSSSSSTGFDD